MCKANFTKVTESGNSKRIQIFNGPTGNSIDFISRSELLNENLYGYENDGFVVEDEVIEYQSDGDNTEIDDVLDQCEQLLERARRGRKRKRDQENNRNDSRIHTETSGRANFASYLQSFTYDEV
jgi:hypothetical protein